MFAALYSGPSVSSITRTFPYALPTRALDDAKRTYFEIQNELIETLHTFIRSMWLTMEWCARGTIVSHFMITDIKGLTRVCFINFGMRRLHTINLSSQWARSPIITPGKLGGDPPFSHLTRFSGITDAALGPEITTLADLRTHFRELIKSFWVILSTQL